jgi:hypothetical protein
MRSLANVFTNLNEERKHWKLQFLNQFLVHNTKSVLAWFATIPAATFADYDRAWRHTIADGDQRATVVDALVQYGLLAHAQDGLRITDDGRNALEFFKSVTPVPFAVPVIPAPVVPMPPRSPALDALLESWMKTSAEEKRSPAPGELVDFVMRTAEGVKGVEVKVKGAEAKGNSSDGAEKS